MAVAARKHPALGAIVAQGFGAGVGKVGRFQEQGNWYRGGAQQMLFTSWLYGTQNDQFKPTLPKDMTQQDLIRISRFYDMATEMPRVDWAKAFHHLPVSDIIKNVDGQKGVYENMIARKPNDPQWYTGGLWHENMSLDVPGYWFVSWFDYWSHRIRASRAILWWFVHGRIGTVLTRNGNRCRKKIAGCETSRYWFSGI
jgi:predicted acyl esterase